MKKTLLMTVICVFLFSPHISKSEIVNPYEAYTYDELTNDLFDLVKLHPELISFKMLTPTDFGRKIWAIKLGHGKRNIFLNGAHHAREWMTSALLMKMIETYSDAYHANQSVDGFHPSILDEISIWFVPMVNPDGVTLQQFGLWAFPNDVHWKLIEMNDGSLDFMRWKANGSGIDLNRQYPTNWENLKGTNKVPSYQFFKGRRPFEAKEVQSLVHFTYEIKPEIAVSYHSSGNVLFWGFHQWGLTHTTEFAKDYYLIAEGIAGTTKYKLEEPSPHQQGGGYTDWFIEEFSKPALTIEIGDLVEDRSLPLTDFRDVWERNKAIGLFLAVIAKKRETNEPYSRTYSTKNR